MCGALKILMSRIRINQSSLSLYPFFSSRAAIFEQISFYGLGRSLQFTLVLYQILPIDKFTMAAGISFVLSIFR